MAGKHCQRGERHIVRMFALCPRSLVAIEMALPTEDSVPDTRITTSFVSFFSPIACGQVLLMKVETLLGRREGSNPLKVRRFRPTSTPYARAGLPKGKT